MLLPLVLELKLLNGLYGAATCPPPLLAKWYGDLHCVDWNNVVVCHCWGIGGVPKVPFCEDWFQSVQSFIKHGDVPRGLVVFEIWAVSMSLPLSF